MVVKEQLQDIRSDLRGVQVEGIAGNVLLGWWMYPLKNFVADPLLGVAEAVVPKVVSVVPFSEPVVSFTLGATSKTGHFVHGIGTKVGVLKDDDRDSVADDAANAFRESLYEHVSFFNTAIGFGFGITTDVLTLLLSEEKLSKWIQTASEVYLFLQKSGISQELYAEVPDFLPNFIILGRLQAMERKSNRIQSNRTPSQEQLEDGQHFMKYATAAYGVSTIEAAQTQVMSSGKVTSVLDEKSREAKEEPEVTSTKDDMYLVDTSIEFATRAMISKHLDIPEDDIVAMFVKPGSEYQVLRHFLAVDHKKKAVVLAIRGTFSVSEILMDVEAKSVAYCGGLAHKGIGEQADAVWEVVGDIVKRELGKHPTYELIITGHSLGAGTSSLLTVKCYHERLVSAKVRCFAFASPPVYTPLRNAREAVANTINYIHDDDCVSFLSVANVRELLEYLKAVGDAKASWMDRAGVILGKKEPTPELIAAFEDAKERICEPAEGAPKLLVPACTVLWMRGDNDVGYHAYSFLPEELPDICADVDMMQDHFPPYYEEALGLLCN